MRRNVLLSILLTVALVIAAGCGPLLSGGGGAPDENGSAVNGFGGPADEGETGGEAEGPGGEDAGAGEPAGGDGGKDEAGGTDDGDPAAGEGGTGDGGADEESLHPEPGRADHILYVKSAESGAGDGSSWSNAFGSLQDALDATGGDETFEIWVAAGRYVPTTDHTGDPNPMDPRTKTFQLRNGVAIFGGFPADADDGIGPEARNPGMNVTVLTGDLNSNGLLDDEDAYHVFYHPAGLVLDHTAILDGFTISGGNADGPGEHGSGGGMLTVSEPGAESRPVIANTIIMNNKAAVYGGGLHNENSSPHLYKVSIVGNDGALGGGIGNVDSSPTLLDTDVIGNTAHEGGGMYSTGASFPNLARSELADNFASNGGGLAAEDGGQATVSDSVIAGNHALERGGGIFADGSAGASLVDSILRGNEAGFTGGGMYIRQGYTSLTNVLISGNYALEGAGMLLDTASMAMYGVTISGNYATDAGGGFAALAAEPDKVPSEPFEIYNSIIWGNGAGEAFDNVFSPVAEMTPLIAYSIVQDFGGSGAWDPGETPWDTPNYADDGGGNLDADPLFVVPIGPEAAPVAGGDYRLSAGSPAIDAGSADYVHPMTAFDLAGEERIMGTAPDMGAYEFNPADS